MNPGSFNYFLTVCQTHSFSKAAEMLYITPQGMSKAMKKLEEELECQLFVRTAEGIVLTAAGEVVKRHAQVINTEFMELQKELLALNKKEVILGTTMGVYQIFNQPILKIIQKKYPDTPISYIETWDLQCEENIRDHVYDLAITSGPVDKKEFYADILCSSPVCVMIPKDHPLYERPFLRLTDLEPYPVLLVSSHFRTYHYFLECCRKAGFEPDIYDTAVMVESMFHTCLNRLAVGIVIDCFVEHRKPSDCRIVPLPAEEIHWELELISAKDTVLSEAAMQIRSTIRQIMENRMKKM